MSKRARGKINPTGADAAPEVGPELTEDGQLPLFFPCLAVEGMPTSDGRTIAADALSHRTLPISVLAQYTNPGQQGGHAGAEVIGHLTEVWRTPGPEVTSRQTGQPFAEGTWVWQGRGVADPDTTGGKLVAKGHLRGNSVDLSEIDYDEDFADDGRPSINITKGVIAATTLCPIPAFADAYVEIGLEPVAASGQIDLDELDSVLVAAGVGPSAVADMISGYEALVANPLPAFRAAELGDDCGPCLAEIDGDEWTEITNADGTITFAPTVAKRRRAFARGLAMKGDKADGSDAAYPIENQADLDKAAQLKGVGDADTSAVVAHIRKAARKLGLKVPSSLTAAGVALPEIALFTDPHLSGPTPLAIGALRADGRREITGHIATWNECHVSYTSRCVRPPHSRTDYARFATGAMRVDDEGTQRTVAVGRISMSRSAQEGGHAGPALSEADAVAFYDNHCTAAADVAAGEDQYGIWIHGLTRQLSEADVDQLLSSPPSGDWRGHRGNLELCAILAVNNPGYVVPRSRVASGEPVSLVAAGVLKPGAEFAQGPLTLQSITDAVHNVVMNALQTFFDPDNDGDIDRPMDDGSGADPSSTHAGDSDDSGAGTRTASLADRQAAALRALRRTQALAEVGAPFGRGR